MFLQAETNRCVFGMLFLALIFIIVLEQAIYETSGKENSHDYIESLIHFLF